MVHSNWNRNFKCRKFDFDPLHDPRLKLWVARRQPWTLNDLERIFEEERTKTPPEMRVQTWWPTTRNTWPVCSLTTVYWNLCFVMGSNTYFSHWNANQCITFTWFDFLHFFSHTVRINLPIPFISLSACGPIYKMFYLFIFSYVLWDFSNAHCNILPLLCVCLHSVALCST